MNVLVERQVEIGNIPGGRGRGQIVTHRTDVDRGQLIRKQTVQ